jgi:hypothetical protein
MLTLKNPKLQDRVKMAKHHFYRVYPYMIRFNLPGASLFRNPPKWLEDHSIDVPKKTTVRYGRWDARKVVISGADLRAMYSFVQDNKCKVRVENNVFNAYFEDREQMENMLALTPEKWIEEIYYVPEHVTYKQVIVKQKRLRDMTHRIHLRNGRISQDETKRLRTLIDQYRDSLEIPIGLHKSIMREDRAYLFSNYFYTKDAGLITFISLSIPGIVTDIFETVCVE